MADNYIIKIEPRDNGGRPALQSRPVGKPAPDGYVLVKAEEAEEYINTFVSSRGFVNIEYADGYLTKMTTNQEALDAYLAENPDPDPVEVAKAEKIAELANNCQEAINNGADVKLADGTTEHFSFAIEDQQNLSVLDVFGGDRVYHADGQAEKIYSEADIDTIYSELNKHKNTQLIYYNLLKQYVNSLTDASAIKAVVYGQDLTGIYAAQYAKFIQTL